MSTESLLVIRPTKSCMQVILRQINSQVSMNYILNYSAVILNLNINHLQKALINLSNEYGIMVMD